MKVSFYNVDAVGCSLFLVEVDVLAVPRIGETVELWLDKGTHAYEGEPCVWRRTFLVQRVVHIVDTTKYKRGRPSGIAVFVATDPPSSVEADHE